MDKKVQVVRPIRQVSKVSNGELKIIKKNVAAYARVSTDYEDQINSYKVQCEEYTNIITSNPNYNFVGVFADQGISGTQAKKRPEFMKMIEKAKEGEIDLIITKSISRFARNTVDTITYVRELRDFNVEVFFEKENISSLDPKIDFMLTILSSIAQEESRAISTNVKWAYDKKFQKGIVDARPLFGYNSIDGKYIINIKEADIVQKIFRLALSRYKVSDIVKSLNSSGIKSAKGGEWTSSSVRRILENEKYCGDAILRKTVTLDYLTNKCVKNDNIADKYYVSNNHDPIVSKEMYDSVQIILNGKGVSERNTNKDSKYPLTGMVMCPKCGRTLKRQQINRGKNMRIVLNCNHIYNNKHNCNSGHPNYDLVIDVVYDSIKEIYANENVLNRLFEIFDRNVAANLLRNDINKLKEESVQLQDALNDDPENIDIYNQIIYTNDKIIVLESDLVEAVSSSVRLEFIKSLVSDERESMDKLNVRDFYSLVIADEKKVTLVISLSKTRDELMSEYKKILEVDPILNKMYVDRSNFIFYEVKIYE